MYSFTDYITEIGSRLSIFVAAMKFISERVMHPVVTDEIGGELNDQELNDATNADKSDDSKSSKRETGDQLERTYIVNKYLNWIAILRSMIKTDNHEQQL